MSRVLVTTDFSENSKAAFKNAIEQSRISGAEDGELLVLHVLEDLIKANISFGYGFATLDVEGAMEKAEKAAKTRLKELCEEHFQGLNYQPIVARSLSGVVPTIVEEVEKGKVDTIVMGTHGRGGITRMILGSVAEAVLRRAEVPVLLVPNNE